MKNSLILVSIVCLLVSCKEEENVFPTDKKYWEVSDYDHVIREIKYNVDPEEQLPTFANPGTQLVMEKLTDEQNFIIVLDDNELGLKHRNEVAGEFFNKWKDMSGIYTAIDRTDKYIYEKEMLEIENFGLALQLKYFKLGNDEIIEDADDPNADNVINVVNSNKRVLVNNMILYLDEINNEKSFSDVGLELISEGIDKYFTELVTIYPDADYSSMVQKIDLLFKKSKSEKIKQSLISLKELIASKTQLPAAV